MQKVKMIFIFIAVIIVTAMGSLYFYQSSILKGIQRKGDYAKAAINATKFIQKVWKDGDTKFQVSKGVLFCPKLGDMKNTGDSYLRCNPRYLACYIKNNYSKFSADILGNKQSINFKIFPSTKDIYQIENKETLKHPLSSSFQTRMSFTFEGQPEKEYSVLLADSCNDTYLPQRIYGYSRANEKRRFMNWRWDNFDRHIYADKFLVSNQEVNDWIDRKNLKIKKVNDPSAPASHLNINQMYEYCSFQGKHLLTAQVYDAFTIHPGKIEEKEPTRNLKYPYPWSRLKREVFLYKARRKVKKGEDEYRVTRKDCLRAHTLDCDKNFKFKFFDTRSVSWSGFYQVLGGPFEMLRNGVEKEHNLKASSRYFKSSSPYQELGKRLYWDGFGNDYRSISELEPYENSNDKKVFQIGFRCMRYIDNEY